MQSMQTGQAMGADELAQTREAIVGVVLKHTSRILDDVDIEELDTSERIVDLGVSSLDLIEVVSCAMRELKIKIPRKELRNLDTIDGLVDLLFATAHKQASA